MSALSAGSYWSLLDGPCVYVQQHGTTADNRPQAPETTPPHLHFERMAPDYNLPAPSAISTLGAQPAHAATETQPPKRLVTVSSEEYCTSDCKDLDEYCRMLACMVTYATVIVVIGIALIAFIIAGARLSSGTSAGPEVATELWGESSSTIESGDEVIDGGVYAVPDRKARHTTDPGLTEGRRYGNELDIDVEDKSTQHYFDNKTAPNISTQG